MGRGSRKQNHNLAQAVLIAVVALIVSGAAAQVSSSAPRNLSKRTLLVSIPDRKLAVIDDGVVLATFRVAVGADVSPSPTGDFEIVSRLSNPTYYHPGNVIPGSKDNPLGTRWLGLNLKGYGIHGTNMPHSIGRAASHGCIRLRNGDAERLFELVQVGDVVQIRGERTEQMAEIFGDVADETAVANAQVSAQAGGQ